MEANKKLVVVVATLLLVGATALVFGGSYVLSDLSDCSGRERAIVERYPRYDDRRIATNPWTFSCSVHLWNLPASAGGILVARRDGYGYRVSYEAPDSKAPDLPDDGALVVVSASDRPPHESRFPK